MMLVVLSKWPKKAARLVPDKIKFKQLLELGQLVCFAGISSVFKPIPQGKEIQEWIRKNPRWTFLYFENLYCWAQQWTNMSSETNSKFAKILCDLKRLVVAINAGTEAELILRFFGIPLSIKTLAITIIVSFQ